MSALGLLRKWAKRDFIVYVRPHYDGKKIVWIVQVEGGPTVLTGYGATLPEACEQIEDKVPNKPINTEDTGWLSPPKKKSKKQSSGSTKKSRKR